MLADGERELQVDALAVAGGAPRHRPRLGRQRQGVALLHQHAAGERAEDEAGGTRIGQAAGRQHPQVLLRGEHGACLVVDGGGNDHLQEQRRHAARRCRVERPVDGDNAAEGAHRVARQRLVPGVGQRGADGDTARIGVFDDGDRRRCEFGDQLEGGVGIGEIVVAELLALHLRGGGDARPHLAAGI